MTHQKISGRDLGYTPRVAIPEDAEDDYVATGCEYTFDCAAGKNLLELQWALQPGFMPVDFDMDGLFERAVNVQLQEGSSRHLRQKICCWYFPCMPRNMSGDG